MYDNKHIPKLQLLQCFPLIIEHGATYTYLINDLPQYLPKLQSIASSNLEFNSLTELIQTMFCCCTTVCF